MIYKHSNQFRSIYTTCASTSEYSLNMKIYKGKYQQVESVDKF